MAPLRRTHSKTKENLKHYAARHQPTHRSTTPTLIRQRQHLKKQQLKRVQRRRKFCAARQAQRERWALIANDTQRIVMGDGKYVTASLFTDQHPGTVTASSLTSPSFVYFASPRSPASSQTRCGQDIPQVIVHDIAPYIQLSKQLSTFYPHSAPAYADWRRRPTNSHAPFATKFTFSNLSTLTAARHLHLVHPSLHTTPTHALPTTSIGVLSFASPRRPGGGYLHGGDQQEETLARSTSLVASLNTVQAREFYKTHKNFSGIDGKGIYDHSMVYSPGVVVFRKEDDDTLYDPHDESGQSKPKSNPQFPTQLSTADISSPISQNTIPPYLINVLSSTPPSYAAIHQTYEITPSTSHIFSSGIRSVLTQRVGRVLRVFEERGDRAIVLGAYGCGSSEINVGMIAEIWAELLLCGECESACAGSERKQSRFKNVFEYVVFALPGKLYAPFKTAFESRLLEAGVNINGALEEE